VGVVVGFGWSMDLEQGGRGDPGEAPVPRGRGWRRWVSVWEPGVGLSSPGARVRVQTVVQGLVDVHSVGRQGSFLCGQVT
jgi:hypothetical protein